ncbi:LysR family transcriptional regulator [Chakrabartyella piscis]|uniref:LysR family transcriptional regulator n=1 Tax=Chakrabartyella piscis TaxID=2918914 RepID=UPI00295872CA|nr:LysR family transcriptional regulator [Chakrabartyella piscis]
MTFDELNTFITLAHNKNFSRTAEILYTSQSTVSFRIKKMEQKIGCALFERNTKQLELTPAGREFLSYAIKIYNTYEEAICVTSNTSFQYKISIGAPDSFWQTILFPALIDYFRVNKNISFELISEHSVLLNQLVADDKLDIGITFLPLQHQNIIYIPLASNPYVLIAHKDLELPMQKVTTQNISSFPFVYFRWTSPFDDWFRENYYTSSYFLELDRIWLLLEMLKNKMGIGFMPLRIAKLLLDSGDYISLEFEHKNSMPLETNFIMYNRKKEERILPILNVIKENTSVIVD